MMDVVVGDSIVMVFLTTSFIILVYSLICVFCSFFPACCIQYTCTNDINKVSESPWEVEHQEDYKVIIQANVSDDILSTM